MNFSGLYLYKTELTTLVARSFIQNGKVNSLKEFAGRVHYDTTKITRYSETVTDNVDVNRIK